MKVLFTRQTETNKGTPIYNLNGDYLGEYFATKRKGRVSFHKSLSLVEMYNKGLTYVKQKDGGSNKSFFSLKNLSKHI